MKRTQRTITSLGTFRTKTRNIFLTLILAHLILSTALIATAQTQPCGTPNDKAIHTPPSYTCGTPPCASNPFPPPVKGSPYVDPVQDPAHPINPQNRCVITRLTDAAGDNLGAAVHHQYGTINPINATDTYVMLLLEDGNTEIVDTSGNVIVPVSNMPGTNTRDMPWDLSISTRFYYAVGKTIDAGDITGLPQCAAQHNCTITTTTLTTFSAYATVEIPDQEDISDDGNHLWLVGDTKAFLYTISTRQAGPVMEVGTKDSSTGWHKIQIMPSNRMLMTWNNNAHASGAGQEVYNTDTTLNWHMLDNTIHTDCGKDLIGNEVCVVSRVPDTGGGITPACPNPGDPTQDGGIDVINMSTHQAQCLLEAHFADTEVSFRDGNAGGGWVFVTFFNSSACPTYSCFDTTTSSHLDPNWASNWGLMNSVVVPYAEEGLLVRIDNNNGPNTYRLFYSRSRSSEYYWAIPRGAISRDGTYVVFDSNFDISNTGLANYTDVYLSHVPAHALIQKSAPGFVQATSQSVAMSAVGSGHLLVVGAYSNAVSGVSMSVSDTQGNTWSSTSAFTNTQGTGGPLTMQLFYTVARSSGNDTITLSQSSGTAPLGGLYFEYSGNSSTNVLDASAGQSAPGSTSSASTPSITTTGSADLVIGFFGDTSGSGTITAGPGYTLELSDAGFYAGAEDQFNVPAGAHLATAVLPSSDAGWIGIIAAFK
jgi:hypothetical protein